MAPLLDQCVAASGLPVLSGNLRAAIQEGRRQAKIVVGYLHAPKHPAARRFCRGVLADGALGTFFRQHEAQLLFWAADIETAVGHDAAQQTGAERFPFLFAIAKGRTVLDLHGDTLTAARLTAELDRALENAAGLLADDVAFRVEREGREALRQQQASALEAAMAEDARREAAAAAAAEGAAAQAAAAETAAAEAKLEEERMAAEAEAEARRAAAEVEAAAQQAEVARATALSRVPPEPDTATPAAETADIRLVTLSGAAVTRRWRRTDAVEALFWLAEAQPDYTGQPFELIAGFPPRPLECPHHRVPGAATPVASTSECPPVLIGDVKALCPRAVVTMRQPVH